MIVKKGSFVKFHYMGRLKNNKVFASTKGKKPLECRVGKEEIIKGIEEGLVGMKKLEKKEIIVSPEDAYGQRIEELVKKMPKNILQGKDIETGQSVNLKSKRGDILEAKVLAVQEDTITIDLNHPLAGETLKFDIEIVEIR